MTPFEVRYPSFATAQAALVPTIATAAASNAASKFGSAQAGNYYYYVTGTNLAGESTGVVSGQVAVTAGQGVTLTITRSAGQLETGYVIYRSRLNGSNKVTGTAGAADGMSDFRQMARIPASGNSTTVYVDLNRDIPGCSKAFVLNLTPGDTALTWRSLLGMLKFDLYPTAAATIPWAQLMFGYLRMSKRAHHVCIKNILPNSQTIWRPFNV
jgi:hypothetical protein